MVKQKHYYNVFKVCEFLNNAIKVEHVFILSLFFVFMCTYLNFLFSVVL
jgi:hypothetical protein